jgi:hypothetical protein
MTAEKPEKPEGASSDLIKKNRQECACNCLPKRYIIVALCFFGMFVIHAMRVNVAVAVVTILDAEAHLKVGSEKAQLTVRIVLCISIFFEFAISCLQKDSILKESILSLPIFSENNR